MARRSTCTVLTVLVLAACSAPEPEEVGARTVDSLGVALIHNPSSNVPVGDPGPLRLEIGGTGIEDGPQVTFHRIAGVIRLSDGRVVVADEGSAELRWFSSDGDFLGSAGARGEGPGEFGLLAGLGTGRADSIWSYDFGLRRFTWFTPGGEWTEVVRLEPEFSSLIAIGSLDSGGFLLSRAWSFDALGSDASGIVRGPVPILRYTPEGRLADTVAVVPGREVALMSEGGRTTMPRPLFARASVHALSDGLLWVGDQTDYRVDGLDPLTGELRRSVRFEGPPLEVTDARVERAVTERLSGTPEAEREDMRRFLRDLPVTERVPAYGTLLGTASGGLWIGPPEYEPAGRWAVFDRDGALRMWLRMAEGFVPSSVGADEVLGVWTDEFGVERVRVYALPAGLTGPE